MEQDLSAISIQTYPERYYMYNEITAGRYLTIYHVGHWSTIGEAYKRLLQYKAAHHIFTKGDYFEYHIIDDFTANHRFEYVTEILVLIDD